MIHETIAHYKITSKLGQGGMGEVYRATDSKLDRDVAIKILPESFAGDRDRIARFNREAKVLAALNHPNIAAIYGIEKSEDIHALVLELVEGETLGERLRREPMTVTEALECCKQIAEALEAAHEKGIIHRDLKPENVKIDENGRVKVLDFGLAKEVADPASAENQGQSPTVTHLTTMTGELLGTAPYMSPEQARAKSVDKRSDIWSFGCVLYECLTGKAMFQGEDVTETLASIIKGEPDWAALPEATPPTIGFLLRKCLNKDRKRRLHDIADARIDIEQALGDPSSSIIRLSHGALRESKAGRGMPSPLLAGLVLGVVLITGVLVWCLKPTPSITMPEPPPIRRLEVKLGVEGNLAVDRRETAFRLSPDGSTLAFLVRQTDGSDQPKFYIRRLTQLKATPLPPADEALAFCFSPDGESIAFAHTNTLERIDVLTGQTGPLVENMEGGFGGLDWGDDGWIVFSGRGGGLFRIPALGGSVQPLATLPEGSDGYGWPQVLPGGRVVLFTDHTDTLMDHRANLMVQELPAGEPQLLLKNAFQPHYLPGSGHLLFSREVSDGKRSLFAAPFDPESLAIGDPVSVIEGILHDLWGIAQFDVSPEGTLVCMKGGFNVQGDAFEWVDRDGQHTGQPMPEGFYGAFSLSPNGQFLAYNYWEWVPGGRQADIWIYEIDKRDPYRLTFDSAVEFIPVWSPSSESVVFASVGPSIVPYWKRIDADREFEAMPLFDNFGSLGVLPWSWHGNDLAVGTGQESGVPKDLQIVTMEGDDTSGWKAGPVTDVLVTPDQETWFSFSYDGRWLAYAAQEIELGQTPQVYVRPFPNKRGVRAVQVSRSGNGASFPRFSPTEDELLFGTGLPGDEEWQIFVVKYSIDKDGTFVPEDPVLRKGGTYRQHEASYSGARSFDVSPDGRILVRKRANVKNPDPLDQLVWIQNFSDVLRKREPTLKK